MFSNYFKHCNLACNLRHQFCIKCKWPNVIFENSLKGWPQTWKTQEIWKIVRFCGYQNWMQKEHGSYKLQIDILSPQNEKVKSQGSSEKWKLVICNWRKILFDVIIKMHASLVQKWMSHRFVLIIAAIWLVYSGRYIENWTIKIVQNEMFLQQIKWVLVHVRSNMKVFNFLCICCLMLTQANLSEQERMILIIGFCQMQLYVNGSRSMKISFFQTLETIQLAMVTLF